MPPRRRARTQDDNSGNDPRITLEQMADVVAQQLQNLMPNLVSQVAQALNIRQTEDGEQSRRNEDEEEVG